MSTIDDQTGRGCSNGDPMDSHPSDTLLHSAVRRGSLDEVVLLLDQGADPCAGVGEKPLDIAVKAGRLDIARVLVDHGEDVSSRENIVSVAVGTKNVALVEFLIRAGADVQAGHPLNGAFAEGDDNMVDTLVAAGADMNWEAFPRLAGNWDVGRIEKVRTRYGVKQLGFRDRSGSTVLDYAVFRRNTTVVRFLVEQCVMTTTRALHTAAFIGDEETFYYLIQHGASTTARDWAGSTLLHVAAAGGKPNIVRAVLKPRNRWMVFRSRNEADVQDEDGLTPLYWAMGTVWPCWDLFLAALTFVPSSSTLDERKETARYLISQGAQIETLFTKHEGFTSLVDPYFIVHELRVLEVLLEVAPHLLMATRNDRGRSLLHAASEYGREDAVRLLLRCGMEPRAKDADGRTPIDLARDESIRKTLTTMEGRR